MSKIEFEQIVERGCGIDVHKQELVVTIRGKGLKEETRKYSSFTSSIEDLRTWLKEQGITHVAMESTGVYWKPVYNILESDFEILLVNARHIKNVPGQKTDKKDSKWIAKLLLSGLLKGSFIPPREIREVRDLTRYRRKVVESISAEKNRLHKILEDANIKLSSVVSNLSGSVATKIIKAILSGQEDVEELVKFHHGKMKASKKELASSLYGYVTDHHRLMLRLINKSIEDKENLVATLDEEIEQKIQEATLELDAALLQTIPGIGKDAAASILAELGNDMSQFPDSKHLASWAGMSPGNNESGGKKKSGRITHGNKYLRSLLVQCAWAATRTKNTYLRSKYDSLAARRGKKKALIAVGHKILIAIYHMLQDKVEYKDLGTDHLENLNKNKQIKHHIKRLKELGVDENILQMVV